MSPQERLTLVKLRHGFVVSLDISEQGTYAALKIAQAFSDAAKKVALHLYYGSLENTLAYFRNLTHLHETVAITLRAFPCTSPMRVVFAHTRFRGFLYTRLLKNPGIYVENGDNLEIRALRRNLSWEQWLAGALAYLGILNLPRASCERESRNIEKFCQSMHRMRFSQPADVPSQVQGEELRQRFGNLVTQIWSEWLNEPNDVSGTEPLKELPELLNALDFDTTSAEVDPWKDVLSVPLGNMGDLFIGTFFHCLNKIKEFNSFRITYGIKDFITELCFNDGIISQKECHLALPIYEEDKHAHQILRHVLEQFPHYGDEFSVQEEPSFFVRIMHLEKIRILPMKLHLFEIKTKDLFQGTTERREVEEVKSLLALKDSSPMFLYQTVPCLDPQGSYRKRENPLTMNSLSPSEAQLPHKTFLGFNLYRHLYRDRPLVTFKENIEGKISEVFSLYRIESVVFSETVADFDYYIVALQTNDALNERILFWVRTEVKERNLPILNRPCSVLGCF